MNTHTPGPWHIGLRSGHNINIIYARDGEDLHDDTGVAEVFNLPMHCSTEEIPELVERSPRYATGIANARLLAAAPDLLEALEILIHNNEALIGEHIARNAIAKAKGGEL